MKAQMIKSGLALAVAALASQAAFAAPMTVEDEYIGGIRWSGNPGAASGTVSATPDVIGLASEFGIEKAVLEIVNGVLNIAIHTNFVKTTGGLGKYPAATLDGKGIGLGDLFLADAWTPYNDPATTTDDPGFKKDTKDNGTDWDLAFKIDDRWSKTSGTGQWYDITGVGNSAILDPQAYMSGTERYRNDQAVALGQDGRAIRNQTGYSIDATNGIISFSLNLAGTALAHAKQIAFHWTMTCANDVIEGEVSVPEPAGLGLFGLGLVGLGLLSKRKAKQA